MKCIKMLSVTELHLDPLIALPRPLAAAKREGKERGRENEGKKSGKERKRRRKRGQENRKNKVGSASAN